MADQTDVKLACPIFSDFWLHFLLCGSQTNTSSPEKEVSLTVHTYYTATGTNDRVDTDIQLLAVSSCKISNTDENVDQMINISVLRFNS